MHTRLHGLRYLQTLMPAAALEGGRAGLVERLRAPTSRDRLRRMGMAFGVADWGTSRRAADYAAIAGVAYEAGEGREKVMRCLRCAIEYGPDEQFCQRCGRALSRPLGEKPAAVESTAASPTEARFFYTTTAPPPLQPGNQGDTEKVTWDTQIVPSTAPSVWGAPAERADVPNSAAEPAAGWDSWAAGKTEDRPQPASTLRALPSLPPAKWVEPAATSGTPSTTDAPARPPALGERTVGSLAAAAANAQRSTPVDDFFGDDDDHEGSALLSGGVNGSKTAGKKGSGKSNRAGSAKGTFARPRYGTKSAADKWSKPRSLALAAIVAIVIVALGAYAFTKQRAYNTDLTNARNLAVSGQYAGALADYNKAIEDWPFNGDAKAGANAVRGAAAAVQQQAQAAAQLQARDNATRQGMLQRNGTIPWNRPVSLPGNP